MGFSLIPFHPVNFALASLPTRKVGTQKWSAPCAKTLAVITAGPRLVRRAQSFGGFVNEWGDTEAQWQHEVHPNDATGTGSWRFDVCEA